MVPASSSARTDGQVVGIGSGFLIADDVVLTNRHVIEDLKQANATAPLVRVSAHADDNGVELLGDPYPLEGDEATWLIGSSPVDALDYAVVKLPKGTDRTPVAKPSPYSFQQGDIYFILQHPMGASLKFGGGTFVSLEGNTRVNYTTNSEPGSSGSPVFTQGWQPVALHRSGSLAYNSGVPLTTIMADATAVGTWP
jgi:V8-like Glu-specific endopeptidase